MGPRPTVLARLAAGCSRKDAGQGAPAGRTYHAAFEGENGLQVFDVWDSPEAFEAFGETLMPILSAAGIDPGEPMISPIHNIIIG